MNKDILAKLLATENITVVHENAPTASFNVRDRVLTLPLWDNLNGDNYDHFIGHEVGHALYTPEEGWHDAVCDRGKAYKSFLNVIEDARIERLIQNKYPGLRRNFINSYKKLMADGFFGATLEEINGFDLIDRINTYFKCGVSAGVRIEKNELPWIKEIESCTTWEQVVDIADRLFAQEKAKKEEEREAMRDMMDQLEPEDFEDGDSEEVEQDGFSADDWEMDDDSEEDGANSKAESESEETQEGETDSTEGEGAEESEEESDSESGGELSGTPEYSNDPISKTEESLHDNIRKEFSDDGTTSIYNLSLNMNKIEPLIIDHKTVYSFGKFNPEYLTYVTKHHLAEYGEKLWKEFQVNNKKSVNYMVKEFEMKKKASEYARTSLAKTGVICPVKMNNYKFSDDIFRKMAVTPEGKNHGMVLYLDWSGSMHHHMKSTIDQLLNLVLFCRQVNIPYRVYAFSDRFGRKEDHEIYRAINDVDVNTLQYKSGFRLMEFFNNKMSRAEFTKMAQLLLAIGQNYGARVEYPLPWQFYLGGTPLDDAIMAGMQIHSEFKKSNRLDIVNTVFLTDGDSHPVECKINSSYERGAYRNNVAIWNLTGGTNIVKFIDPVTKKTYRVDKWEHTKRLLEMFRDHTQSNAIGYRIVGVNKRHLMSDLRGKGLSYMEMDQLHSELKKNKFCTIPNSGYNKFFAIAGGKSLAVANTTIEVEDDAKVGAIRNAFKKANANRKTSRVLLSQFIDMVA
jgi:hypothetical protein